MKNFSVVFLAFLLFVVACKKEQIAAPALTSVHTKKLAKDWTWSRSWIFYQPDTVDKGGYSDTTIPVSVINDTTVQFMGVTFSYTNYHYEHISIDENEKLAYFDKSSFNGFTIHYIEYYYKTDSAVYVEHSRSFGASSYLTYTSIK